MKTFSSSSLFFIFFILFFATFTFSYEEEILKHALKNYLQLKLPSVSGPESLTFDCADEGPYTGVSDGRIFKWEATQRGWFEFAVNSPHRDRKLCDGSTDPDMEPLCGRPLGLQFNTKTCNFYIADAYFGLLVVGPNGGVAQQLATSADDGVPFKYLNGLDVDDQIGVVYFTDTSSVYQRREFLKIPETGDKTGRLLKYDPISKKVEVLLKDIASPNGVALSQDASFLLLAQTSLNKISKFWLKGPKAYTYDHFAQVDRLPDNIKRDKRGHYWVALFSDNINATSENGVNVDVGVKFDENGKILEVLNGEGGQVLVSASEVNEHNGRLWIGSASKPYVLVLDKSLKNCH